MDSDENKEYETDSDRLLPLRFGDSSHHARANKSRYNKLRKWALNTILMAFILSYIVLVGIFFGSRCKKECLLGNENIFSDIPMRYEYRRFTHAGFHDRRHNIYTPYEGAPSSENNAAWDRLLDVGIIAISREENALLVNGSAKINKASTTHMIELEMFHQIHCLKWLRDQFWQLDSVVAGTGTLEDIPQRRNHTDHCIDYLRQVIMCHGDVTPITFEWVPEIQGLIAHHSTEHLCRDFKALYGWAKSRGVPGFSAGGNHVNVDIKSEQSD